MSGAAGLGRCTRGAAAVELAMVLPMMLVLLFSVVEAANYAFDEHRLLRGLRDGARYAARQDLAQYSACSGSPSSATVDNTKLLVRKGSLDSTAADLIAGWWASDASFAVTVACRTTVTADANGSVAMNVGGIYQDSSYGAPVVTVSADLPYQPVLHRFGFRGLGLRLKGSEQAAVAGA